MVIAAPKIHTHKYEVVKDRGTCKCGRIVVYTGDGKDTKMKVIMEGQKDYKDPIIPASPFRQTVQLPGGKSAKEILAGIPERKASTINPEFEKVVEEMVRKEDREIMEPNLKPVPPKPTGGVRNGRPVFEYQSR